MGIENGICPRMWSIVKAVSDGREPTLSTMDQNYTEWMEKDECTYAYIKCHINNECMTLIDNAPHAQEAWKILLDHYIGTGPHQANMLHTSLYQFHMEDTRLLEPQINELR
jgi:hypothetical protein